MGAADADHRRAPLHALEEVRGAAASEQARIAALARSEGLAGRLQDADLPRRVRGVRRDRHRPRLLAGNGHEAQAAGVLIACGGGGHDEEGFRRAHGARAGIAAIQQAN